MHTDAFETLWARVTHLRLIDFRDFPPPISDYSIVTVGLRRNSLIKNVDLAIYARNLLDEDAREPSESATSLPFDLPFAGRSIFGEISVRF